MYSCHILCHVRVIDIITYCSHVTYYDMYITLTLIRLQIFYTTHLTMVQQHSFFPKYTRFQLENLRGIMCHDTLKGVAKFKEKLTCGLKNDIRNLVNFHASSWKSENLHFDWIHLSKAHRHLDEKVQKSYVSWHWRVMQSLKKNWLFIPKMTWGIWWILMRAVASLEICNLMYYFCQ